MGILELKNEKNKLYFTNWFCVGKYINDILKRPNCWVMFFARYITYFKGIKYIGYFALIATVYLMVAFLVAILVKRIGLSIIIYFVLVVIFDSLLWLGLTFKQSQVGYFTFRSCRFFSA